MGHTMSTLARPSRRLSGTVTGKVPFSPLSQPPRVFLRVRRQCVFMLMPPVVACASAGRIKPARRVFR